MLTHIFTEPEGRFEPPVYNTSLQVRPNRPLWDSGKFVNPHLPQYQKVMYSLFTNAHINCIQQYITPGIVSNPFWHYPLYHMNNHVNMRAFLPACRIVNMCSFDTWIIADGRGVEPRKLLRSPHFECGCSPFAPPSIQLSNHNLLSLFPCLHWIIHNHASGNSFSTLCIRCQCNHSCIHSAFMSSERAGLNRTITTDWIVGILPLYDRRMNT